MKYNNSIKTQVLEESAPSDWLALEYKSSLAVLIELWGKVVMTLRTQLDIWVTKTTLVFK